MTGRATHPRQLWRPALSGVVAGPPPSKLRRAIPARPPGPFGPRWSPPPLALTLAPRPDRTALVLLQGEPPAPLPLTRPGPGPSPRPGRLRFRPAH